MFRTTFIGFSRLQNIFSKSRKFFKNHFNQLHEECTEPKGLILGVHVSDLDLPNGRNYEFTRTGERFNRMTSNRLREFVDSALPAPRLGEGKIFYGLDQHYPAIALVGLGDNCLGYNPLEHIDERKEAIRTAVGVGMNLLKQVESHKVFVDSCGHAESAAEGASLGAWIYQDLKSACARKPVKKIHLFDSKDITGWKIGLHKAAAQNFARLLTETPANNLTPSTFAQTTIEMLSRYGINVNVRMQNWAKLRNFHGFLSASKGSCEPPVLLEILYEGCNPDVCPIVLIGKGVMFNAGGLCLRKYQDMKHARGDMSGAASIVATIRAIASLQLPINVVGLLPLIINAPGATACRPGDIVRTYNGKTIMVEDTNCEGLLLYADVLAYTKEYQPKFVLDIGTMSPDMIPTMSNCAAGVWCNNESLLEVLRTASIHTGDRIFQLPLWNYFNEYMSPLPVADFSNKVPYYTGGGPCKVAAFLKQFVPDNTHWLHVDTLNTNYTDGHDYSYLAEGMTGRYTRMLVELLAQCACRIDEKQT